MTPSPLIASPSFPAADSFVLDPTSADVFLRHPEIGKRPDQGARKSPPVFPPSFVYCISHARDLALRKSSSWTVKAHVLSLKWHLGNKESRDTESEPQRN